MPADTQSLAMLEQLAPADRERVLAAARAKGIGEDRVEFLLRWVALSPHRQARILEEIYSVVACSDSEVIRRRMLIELAGESALPADLVIDDYNRWLRGKDHPTT